MKECEDCEFFNGYDYSDCTPYCEYDGGYENCPYNDLGTVKKCGMKIEIDSGFMSDYIRHTLKNTIECSATDIAKAEIKNFVTEDLKNRVEEEIEKQVKTVISEEIYQFMQKEITIGGGWSDPERTLTREQYLAETIEKELKIKFKSDALKSYAQTEAKRAIDEYDLQLRNEVNRRIKTCFDSATRETLTQNVVSMLMDNDTYKKLSDSLTTFLPSKKENG